MKESREIMKLRTKVKGERRLIDIRRTRVMELISKGHTNQSEIARLCNVSEPTISRDVAFLEKQACDGLRTHIQKRLPFLHAKAMTGINDLLLKTNDILDNDAKDPKLRLQTINTLANLYAGIITMASDGNIIQQSMEKVEHTEDIKRGKYENTISTSNEEPAIDEDADIIESEEDIPTEPEEDVKEEE